MTQKKDLLIELKQFKIIGENLTLKQLCPVMKWHTDYAKHFEL